MPCCPLPAGRFFVGMWYMPLLYRNNEELDAAKKQLLTYKRRYDELKKLLSGYRRRWYSQDEIAEIEHEALTIARKYRRLARNINYNNRPLAKNVTYWVKTNKGKCGATKRRCWKHGDKIVEAAYERAKKYPCPVCKKPNQLFKSDAYEICPTCGWEDDPSRRKNPDDVETYAIYDIIKGQPVTFNQARKMWANGETLYPDYPNPNRKLRLYRKKVHAAH